MSEQPEVIPETQSDHPDNVTNELADDAEVDALVKDIDPSAPVLAEEGDE